SGALSVRDRPFHSAKPNDAGVPTGSGPQPNRPKRGHSHVAQRGHSHVAVTQSELNLDSEQKKAHGPLKLTRAASPYPSASKPTNFTIPRQHESGLTRWRADREIAATNDCLRRNQCLSRGGKSTPDLDKSRLLSTCFVVGSAK